MRLKVAAIVAGIALTFGVSPLRAHHSLEDTHDLRRTVTLTGVISSVEWVNPHARLYLDVTGANGVVARWSVELGAPNTMTRFGAGPDVLKPGDQVSVDVWIAKDSSLTASGQALKLSDGRTLQMASGWRRP